MAIDRSTLRLSDLKGRAPTRARMLNVKLPASTVAAIARLSKQLHTTRTNTVVALLNEGLAVAARKTGMR